jgi:hypothetical protein
MKKLLHTAPLLLALMASCSDDIPMVSLGLDDVYYVSRMQKLPLHPELSGSGYRWLDADGELLSTERDYLFVAVDEGTYQLALEILNEDSAACRFDFSVVVSAEEIAYSPYIAHVYEYLPAPGQFVNVMPKWEEGDTAEDMRQKAENEISGTNDGLITLGGYGGYVVFGFDHTVVNKPGEKDFKILGNSFYQTTTDGRLGGSSEPGIVMVSYDTNCNGLPDDPWYELAGSDYSNPLTLHNYAITYHQPDPNREVVTQGTVADLYYIRWTDSEGAEEYMPQNAFHRQAYFPAWIQDEQLVFTGTRLPNNAELVSGNYVMYCFDWGYVDNHPNSEADLISFDISWAVDANGLPVKLPGIDFVKVYTAVNQCNGWIGEISTEICRAQDLHVEE